MTATAKEHNGPVGLMNMPSTSLHIFIQVDSVLVMQCLEHRLVKNVYIEFLTSMSIMKCSTLPVPVSLLPHPPLLEVRKPI